MSATSSGSKRRIARSQERGGERPGSESVEMERGEKREPAEYGETGPRETQSREARPFLGVFFRCCQVYQRIYRHPDGTRYAGFCPRCTRPLEVKVGAEGSSQRLFTAE